MIKLFEIDDKYELQINKEWVLLVPAFAQVIKKDRGSEGDYRGEKKLMAKKKLGFVYLMLDFASPLRELSDYGRRERAMEYLALTEKDLNDPDLADAMATYQALLEQNARALRTLKAVKRGLDSMDSYFENVDFEKVDKQGKLLYNPKEYVSNITEVKKAYESLNDLEESIMEQLTHSDLIRGDVELGDLEENRSRFTELLTLSESAAREKASKALVKEDIDLTTFEPPDDETYQVVDRPVQTPTATQGKKFADMGMDFRAVGRPEEEDGDDGLL